jgi:hypothetical protein
VSDRLVRDLARRGIVVRAGRNLYKLEESVRNVVEDMRKQLGRRGGRGVAAEAAAERGRKPILPRPRQRSCTALRSMPWAWKGNGRAFWLACALRCSRCRQDARRAFRI